MKIRKELPQFRNERALLAATGQQEVKFYLAHGGIVEELELYLIPNPRYTDREGFFAERRTTELGSGSVYEPKKLYIENRFLHWLKNEIKEVCERQEIDSVYLFAPDYISKRIFAAIPEDIHSKIKFKLSGNFTKSHPFELLSMLKKEIEKIIGQKVPRKEEARKLLKKKKY